MTITYDPRHAAYVDEADVRDEQTRVFDVCQGCRRCVSLCSSFPSLFEMLDGLDDRGAGALTPSQQDRVVDECFQCRRCSARCPYVPGLHELAIDFPRLMLRARAMRHATGQRTMRTMIADQLLGRTDLFGKAATSLTSAINWVVGAEPGSVRRRLLTTLTGISAGHRLPPYARRRFSSSLRRRRPGVETAADRCVTVFPTCLVEYRRPQIGHALIDLYARNGIACEVAGVGCCGAPWLTAGDSKRFARRAARNVATLAAAIRAGTDVVVAQPNCHAVITTDYLDHVAGADAELVAARTFDAVAYLADHLADHSADQQPTELSLGTGYASGMPAVVVHHESCPGVGDGTPSASRALLELTGATVAEVRRCTGVDSRWGWRATNERISLAIAHEIGAEIGAGVERSGADVVTGTCVVSNASISELTGRTVIHPLEFLADIR